MRRIVLSSVVVFTLVILGAAMWFLIAGPASQRDALAGMLGVIKPPTGIGGPIELVSSTGETLSEQSFKGKYALVFFGYSFCPDVCPTGLQNVSLALDKLGDKSAEVVPIFISVDPDRDTPSQLASYVEHFHQNMIGLTGSKEQIKAVTRRFRVYYAMRNGRDSKDYLVDHSAFVYLMDPNWKLRAVFNHSASPDDIAAALGKLL